ncbi:hypothetical protein CVV38_00590 [Candidatus Peregrinibacteria bacterium HGW-Peregrinibacteria-1]|jgi:hypothetical protein|nr:MAG: hypothetical protein CVV38_00590 [Candidatus Peregrinibacteria bacterium HGW-Peregrinibacteria-1]
MDKKEPKSNIDIVKEFKKENKHEQTLLLIAGIVFISTFLPWMSILRIQSYNGWNGAGLITVIASILYLLQWALPKFKVKVPKISNSKKILILGMLAGPVLMFLSSIGSYNLFNIAGIGFYIALFASGYGTYLAFSK